MNRKAFIPITALLGALLLALVATMTPFIAEPDRAYAQAPSANADLATLEVEGSPSGTVYTGGDLDPTFAAATRAYTVRTNFNDTGVTVTVTAADTDATIRVNGRTPNASNEVGISNIPAGATSTINIVVTAEAGNTKTYTVKVYRNRSPLLSNANLSSLSISPSGGLKESATSTSAAPVYEARVQDDEVTVSYSPSDSGGAVSVAIAATTAGAGSPAVDGMDVTLADEGNTTAIALTVTPECGATAAGTCTGNKVYTINVYRIRDNRSPDADLSGLTLTPDSGSISGYTFAAATTTYDLTVDNGIDYVTVAPAANDAGAILVTSPADERPADPGHQVNLRAGADRTITVMVTAEDPSATKTYTLMIYKRRASTATNPDYDDATLSALGLSMGTLMPTFSSGTAAYSAQVADDVEKVTVSYTPTNDLGGVTVVGAAATTSGDTSTITPAYDAAKNEVTLDGAGVRTDITLTVTAEDGATTGTYTITVYRLRALPSADATLNALAVTNADTTGGAPAPTFTPTFAAGTTSYNSRAAFGITTVTVAATATAETTGATVEILPADADDADGHQVELAAGAETEITVTVTAEDRTTTSTYTVTVYRENNPANISDDATLSALSLSAGTLMPAFMSDTMAYTARVGSAVGEVTVSSTPTDDAGGVIVAVTATNDAATPVPCDGSATTCDVDGMKVTLESGGSNTIISVAVTPEAGAGTDNANVKTYMITVYRERSNLNPDATLSAFMIDDVNPATGVTPVNSADCTFTDVATPTSCNLLTDSMPIVDYRVRTVSITATATDAGGALVEIVSPADKNPSTPRHDIDLMPGQTTDIEVLVTAEDGSTTKTYMASVYRKRLSASNVATLSSLMVNGAILTPAFASGTMEYTADSAMAEVTVSAMPTDDAGGARVSYMPDDADNDDSNGHQVELGALGTETVITVQVKPESVDVGATATQLNPDGSNDCSVVAASRVAGIACYTVTVTRVEAQSPRDEATLLSIYDTNGTPGIQIDEAVTAVGHYADGTLLIEEIVIIVGLYATGSTGGQ